MAEQYLDYIVETFYDHLNLIDDDQQLSPVRGDDAKHLQGYLANWVEMGEATETTGGNFDTFMRAVVRIIDDYHKDPTLGGRFEPGAIEGILNPEQTSVWFMDPDFFAAEALRRQLPKEIKHLSPRMLDDR